MKQVDMGMTNSPVMLQLMSSLGPDQWGAMVSAFLPGGTREQQVAAVQGALHAGGRAWRTNIGKWVTSIVPVEVLVIDAHQRWRPLVQDAFRFLFSHLSSDRLATKIVEQLSLDSRTPAESRLLTLISRMPGVQKLGQVLARNRRLSPALREALSELENGMSDVTAADIQGMVRDELGERLERYGVELDSTIFKEGSAGAILRFRWQNSDAERQRGVFKVLKPYVPECFAEDMALLMRLGDFLTAKARHYDFDVRDIRESLEEVRTLLQHELDFEQEQRTLLEARRIYRSSIGIRVPTLIPQLCTQRITAMSEESSIKVTDAYPRSPNRRARIANQLVEALIAVPLFSREDMAVFHADPHAGNLMYDQTTRELILIDWALADRLSLESRRQLVLLVAMTVLRNEAGVRRAIRALSDRSGSRNDIQRAIDARVGLYFSRLPASRIPGALDAMRLLDDVALAGVHFPPALFFFRKSIFTLDGVLQDIAGKDIRIDYILGREFVTRCLASFGMLHAPLQLKDFTAALG